MTIDGSTEPAYAGVPLVRLDGSSAGAGANGLHIVAGNSTVRGLSITGFNFDGIRLETGGGNLVAGNWIGVALGGGAAGNGAYGVETRSGSANNVIGGAGTDANVISANGHTGPTYSGVGVFDPGTTGNVIKGNLIGTDVAGSAAAGFGNGFAGVLLRQSSGNSVGIGGVGNVISGNVNAGVYLDTEANDTVLGNRIGTNAAGTAVSGTAATASHSRGAPATPSAGRPPASGTSSPETVATASRASARTAPPSRATTSARTRPAPPRSATAPPACATAAAPTCASAALSARRRAGRAPASATSCRGIAPASSSSSRRARSRRATSSASAPTASPRSEPHSGHGSGHRHLAAPVARNPHRRRNLGGSECRRQQR